MMKKSYKMCDLFPQLSPSCSPCHHLCLILGSKYCRSPVDTQVIHSSDSSHSVAVSSLETGEKRPVGAQETFGGFTLSFKVTRKPEIKQVACDFTA